MGKHGKRERSRGGSTAPASSRSMAPPRGDPGAVVHLTSSQSLSYHSPIPPPEVMEAYAAIDPQFVPFIIEQVREQAGHRRQLERQMLAQANRRSVQGLLAGTVVTLAAIAAATVMALAGAPLAGMAVVIAELAILAGVFVKGTHDQRQERERRAKLMAGDDSPQS